MKVVTLICRIFVGLGFIFFGANIVHPFLHMPPMPGADTLIGKFNIAMMDSGWMKVIGATQILGGLFVLSGAALPLGLCLLCPMTFNILCCHLFLMHGAGIAPGALLAVLELVLIYAYRESFDGILSISEKPTL